MVTSERLLPTFDPDWESRWTVAEDALKAARADTDLWSRIRTSEEVEEGDRRLGALNDAFHAQFRTVESYFDHRLQFELPPAKGLDVPYPVLPAGATLEDARAIIKRFVVDIGLAERSRNRPIPKDPSDIIAFTAVQRPGSQRSIEEHRFFENERRTPIDCLVAMEATSRDLHICFIDILRISITNNIEDMATRFYSERFAPRSRFDRLRCFAGQNRPGVYPPNSVVFYEYLPWHISARVNLKEELSFVKMDWKDGTGFSDPVWKNFGTVPPYLAGVAEPSQREVDVSPVRESWPLLSRPPAS